MSHRHLATLVFAPVLVLSAACAAAAQPAATSSPQVAAPAPAAPAFSNDYCTALADVSTRTRAIASGPDITPAQYAEAADALDHLATIAPATAKSDITVLASTYRKVSTGATTLAQSGSDVAKATLRLAQTNQQLCRAGG